MIKSLVTKLKWYLKPIVENDIYLQSAGMFLLRRIPVLLPHDPDYHALRHFFQNDDEKVFLDIGANVGLSALSFRRLNRNMKIVSIEPNPIHTESLSKIKKNDLAFDYKMVAAGDKRGEMELYVPSVGSVVLHTIAALSYDDVRKGCDMVLAPRYRTRVKIKSYKVSILTIDEMEIAPQIIKIDAEGAEEKVLIGAEKTIQKHRPYLMVENNPWYFKNSQNILSKWGYELFHYDQKQDRLTREVLKARNAFFIPKEKMQNLSL